MVLRVCSVKGKGKCQLVFPKRPNGGVHSVSLLMKGRAEVPWNGKVLWCLLPFGHTLLLCLLPCRGNKAEDPLQAQCLPFRNPRGGGKRTGTGHPGLACPLSKEMHLDFQLTFRLLQAKRGRVTELLTAILLHLQIVWVVFYWNAAFGRFWVWLQGEVEGLWLLQHVNPLLPASPALLS